jgi:hypothetical protein
MLSAPNRYRRILNEHTSAAEAQDKIIELMAEDFPDRPNPVGIDMDPVTWDLVLLWA